MVRTGNLSQAMSAVTTTLAEATGMKEADCISTWRAAEDGSRESVIAFPKQSPGLAAKSGLYGPMGLCDGSSIGSL